MEEKELLEKATGCLKAVYIGDAMGRFAESLTHEQILEKTDGQGIKDFVYFERDDTPWLKGVGKEELGNVTDDSILTDLIAESLIDNKGFDLWDIALKHVGALEESDDGWGRTTVRGVEELRHFFDTRGREGRRPGKWRTPVKSNLGCGNGVAMKIAPVALYNAFTYIYSGYTKLDEHVTLIGSLTHPNKLATSAAYVLAKLLFYEIVNPKEEFDDWFDMYPSFIEHIKWYEKNILGLPEDASIVEYLMPLADKDVLNSPKRLRQEVGTSCYALQSVPFAIAVYLRHMDDFRAGVLEAVNAGGDTDTIASMAGALIGARVGVKGIPEEWRNFNPEYKKADELAEKLIQVGKSG